MRASFFAACISCGKTERCHRSPIDAHHYVPSTKLHEPSDLFRKLYPLQVVLRELLKCIPLCRSCHVKIHERRVIPMEAVFNFTRPFLLGVIEEHGADLLDFLPGYPHEVGDAWQESDLSAWSHNSYVVGGLLGAHIQRVANLAEAEAENSQIVWKVYRGDLSLLRVLSRPT